MIRPRKILNKIERYLGKKEIVVIHGARQTGKTTLLKIIRDRLIQNNLVSEKNIFYFDLEDFEFLKMFNNGHKEVASYIQARLGGTVKSRIYLLIDEIQYLANPSSLLKILHDHYEWIRVIVSGSSSFQIKSKFKDSLVGRTVDFELFPLDFEEFLVFKEAPYDLHNKKNVRPRIINNELSRLFREYCIYGGYPKVVMSGSIEDKLVYLKQVIDTYIKKDIRDLGHIKDVNRFNNLLRVLADSAGSLINCLELSSTVAISRKTIEDYLFIMENTYVIKLVSPFFTNVRSEISKMPKLFFEDTGVLNLLKYGFFLEKIDGELFENAVYGLIRSVFGREAVNYWRSKQKLEIDFVVNFSSKRIPAEAKLSYPQKSFSAMSSFMNRHKIEEAWIISLKKPAAGSGDKRVKYLYPWEVYAASKSG